MAGDVRITVRGGMSERFCQRFPGLRRDVVAGRTVLRGAAGSRPVEDLLSTLGNLGLEVVGVQTSNTPEES